MFLSKEIVAGFVAVAGVAGGGWGAHEYLNSEFASKEAVMLAGGKADFVLDQRIEALVAQIAFLEAKRNKTAEELNQLNHLRQQLDIARKVQRGK
jgi:hypothetical protein